MLRDKSEQRGGRRGHRRRGGWLGKLHGELRGLLAPVFAQARSRFAAFAYISALLAEPGDRKSCWQLAEEAGHRTPRRMQALLAEYRWDWKAALKALQRFVVTHLGDPEAVLVLDETAELKKGQATAGVARQHAGITGQVENCQTVVFAAYVTGRAHALFDFLLYLPRSWCQDTARAGSGHTSRRTWSSPPRRSWARRWLPPRSAPGSRSPGWPAMKSTGAAPSCAKRARRTARATCSRCR